MKKVFYIIIVIFILAQFLSPKLPETSFSNPDDLIINNPEMNANVQDILRNSCYDCHSNETGYPWYSYISPISFLISRDTKLGREELNFSEWETLSKIERAGVIDDITDEVSEGEMPMSIYTLIHRDAGLNDQDKEILINWFENYADSLFE